MDINLIKQIRLFGSSITVLYVEDEDSIRKQVRKTLLNLFDCVDVATDGVEALSMHKEKKYDLIITDLKMPNMDGVELCKKLVEINKDQSIVLISAHKEADEVLKLLNIGVSGFLLKPIDMPIMLDKLHSVVKNIYANKMMKYHYEEIEKEILENTASSQEELEHRDALTSLYNQKYFLKIINNETLKWAILININDFRLINDYYSYAHGNHLLFQIAELLRVEAKEYGYGLFRLSNDEFVLLRKETPKDCEELKEEAVNISRALDKKRYTLIGVSNVSVSVTMGIARSQHHLIEYLQRALIHAKRYGLRYAIYGDVPDDRESVKNIIEIKELLKNSIEKDLIIPVYQPIMMKNKEYKYEVLMRIRSSQDSANLLSPALFLEIAKNHSYYNEISQMVIFKAIDKMLVDRDIVLSINFSYADMKNIQLLQNLQDKIVQNALGKRLIFEIVESDQLDNINIVKAFIERFRAFDVKFAIDDFGSGYSNFSHIFLLNPDFIKIDGSLIKDMLSNKNMYIFVETIIIFAHKLGVEVVAEHVSTKELHDALVALDIDAMQGYYIGYPKEIME